METLDDHAEQIGSGPYASLAAELQKVANSMQKQAADTRRKFATEMLIDVPSCALSETMVKFVYDRRFMSKLVRKKALQLQKFNGHCGAIMGTAWKIEITDALLPYDERDMNTLEDVRNGIYTLLVARSGFLPQILNRLDRLGITPWMLCNKDLGGDEWIDNRWVGGGASAEDFLSHEPRMLRWILGYKGNAPWPTIRRFDEGQPAYERQLIKFADLEGGDDKRVNEACTCKVCKGVRIPTIDCPMTTSEASECRSDASECGSEGGDEMVL